MKKVSRTENCAGFEALQSGMEQDEGSRILLPTMKTLGSSDNSRKAEKAAPAAASAPAAENVKAAVEIDFSNVKIEPLFEEMVDFETSQSLITVQ